MEARLNLRRLLSIAALAAAVASASACGGGGSAEAAAQNDPPVKYADQYLSFTHPAAWTASKPTGPGLGFHFNPIVYLSTQPLGNPCHVSGNETTCGWPLKRLEPGGVLAVWQIPYALPGFSLETQPGKPLEVGGASAKQSDVSGGLCRSIGADRTIDVVIKLGSGNYRELTGCLRAPGVAENERRVDALLASTKFPAQ
jgi:hypothetical protein